MEFLLLLAMPLFGMLSWPDGDQQDSSERAADSDDVLQDDLSMQAAGLAAPAAAATSGDDNLHGGLQADSLAGGNGNDAIYGYRNADTLDGGAGDDTVSGGLGNDSVMGGSGDDLLMGRYGSDLIGGGTGDDTVWGGYGVDTIGGGAGNDEIHGGGGKDVIALGDGDDSYGFPGGERGSDRVDGGNGDDLLSDGLGADTLWGGDGDDTINGGGDGRADQLVGGTGEDRLTGNDGDHLTGGADDDQFLINWRPGDTPVTITDFGSNSDTAEGVQIVLADGGTGTLTVTLRADGTGSDLFVDGALAVRLEGVTDPLNTGTLRLMDSAEGTSAVMTGTPGNDVLDSFGNATQVSGLAGDDHIIVRDDLMQTGTYDLRGDAGDDTLEGGLSDGTLAGGAGDDSLWDNGADALFGGDGNDSIYLEGLIGNLTPTDGLADGGAGNDRISTDSAGVTLTGGAGIDRFEISYGETNDTVFQSGSAVTITDFDPTVEHLRIDTTPIESSWTDLNVIATDDGQGSIVRLGTRQIAILQGVAPAEVPMSAITVHVQSPF